MPVIVGNQSPCSATQPDSPPLPVKFHLSLNVNDLAKSIAFYRALFDKNPAKHFADYAKFELDEPPLVLSLEPQPHAGGGPLNHLGFRVSSTQTLIDTQRRLETSGIPTTREDGVECCHARQTKFWVADPDNNNWEIYILEEDIEHRGAGSAVLNARGKAPESPQPPKSVNRWEHSLGTPFPSTIPLKDSTADEVLLKGTFNDALTDDQIRHILSESRRVLHPAGKISIHGLVSNLPVSDPPDLPGPASAVRFVPLETMPLDTLAKAGFASIRLVKFSDSPVFIHNGAHFRELLVEAQKHEPSPFAIRQTVLYLGPMSQITDDRGTVYHRGVRTTVTSDTAELLRTGSLADSFLFLPPDEISK
jgi:catechol 2,3-dioxygenase-like lactoylglutathione lyase family enzyme